MDNHIFPVFKGAMRSPLIFGIPLMPFLLTMIGIVSMSMIITFWLLALVIPAWIIMRIVTYVDERAFRQLGLALQTSMRNPTKSFWKGSSYSPTNYHRLRKRK
ncbi:type IV secretion system protein VirB3 [Halomonas casei]|uniref:type IV secretion system protein VirB3 n=1 Tax=Halomonas casei TaxID=2742613 RepID=UPI003CF70571